MVTKLQFTADVPALQTLSGAVLHACNAQECADLEELSSVERVALLQRHKGDALWWEGLI